MKKIVLLSESSFNIEKGGHASYIIDSERKKVELIRTSLIDSRIPFPYLNPLQTIFYLNYSRGNVLVSAPSSAGKSLIGYMFILKNRKKGGISIYTAPTKALVYEKAKEFKRYFKTVSIRTGDKILDFLRPVTSEIVLSTYENLVYTFRNRANWLEKIDCIVFDEIHHIVKKWIVEEAIVYALEKNIPSAGLSATLPGLYDMAYWMKCELVIESDWRPVPLKRDLLLLRDFKESIHIDDSRESKIAAKIITAVKRISNKDEKVIVFVPKKSLGWRLLHIAQNSGMSLMNETAPFEVKSYGFDIAFHNADIPQEERYLIEREFREGKLNILVATQTLAYGVNLPADRTIIAIKGWFDVNSMKYRFIPDILDILQEEGRAGRLGIKDIGYSNWLIYGVKQDAIEATLEECFREGLKTDIVYFQKDTLINALSLWILIGFHYLNDKYKDFLEKIFSLRNVSNSLISETEEFLRSYHYISKNDLTEKGLFCIKSGIPPLNFEEFLKRLERLREFSDIIIVIRPLLFMRKFDTLFKFIEQSERFEKDLMLIFDKVTNFGSFCIDDNTHQLLFFTEGLTFFYPNIVNPPGEFSSIRTDALHLIRVLLELRKLNFLILSNKEIVSLAHTIKYGIPLGFSQLGSLTRIGHIRGNLIRRVLQLTNFKIPDFGQPADDIVDFLLQENNLKLMGSILINERKISKEKTVTEIATLSKVLRENIGNYLIDKDILAAFGGFFLGQNALFMNKEVLIEKIFH